MGRRQRIFMVQMATSMLNGAICAVDVHVRYVSICGYYHSVKTTTIFMLRMVIMAMSFIDFITNA